VAGPRAIGAVLAVCVLVRAPLARADDTEEPPSSSAAKLAADFSDPLTTVPQLFVQDAFGATHYGTEARTNRVIVRLIVPRVPRFSLFPFVQLVRPSFSLVTVPTGKGKGTRTEFGDMQLFDLAVLPWPGRETGWYMGIGPVFVLPTATHETAGQNAWQVGPAYGTIYKGVPGLLIGCLIQNPISFAYTRSPHRALSTLLFQPIVLQYLGHGFYVKSADATWSVGWHRDAAKTFPLSFGLGYVWLRPDRPPINFFVSGEWMAHRQDAPVAPQTMVRFGVTVAFPELSPW